MSKLLAAGAIYVGGALLFKAHLEAKQRAVLKSMPAAPGLSTVVQPPKAALLALWPIMWPLNALGPMK